jgi:hypothetical protein
MPSSPDEETILKLYLSIGDAERHFNTIQNGYRVLASTWTLAALGGIGYVLTSRRSLSIDVEKQLICCAVALSGAASILMLWLVDIRVYQQLLSQYFNEGMAMEAGEPWLPQVRNQTRRAFKGKLSRYISVYYILLFVFLLVIACIFMILSPTIASSKTGSVLYVSIAVGVGLILMWAILASVSPEKITGSKKPPDDLHSLEMRTLHYQATARARALDSQKPADPSMSG